MTVDVFCMRVEIIYGAWPEQAKRRRQWMSLAQAAQMIEEPALKGLIQRLESALEQLHFGP